MPQDVRHIRSILTGAASARDPLSFTLSGGEIVTVDARSALMLLVVLAPRFGISLPQHIPAVDVGGDQVFGGISDLAVETP